MNATIIRDSWGRIINYESEVRSNRLMILFEGPRDFPWFACFIFNLNNSDYSHVKNKWRAWSKCLQVIVMVSQLRLLQHQKRFHKERISFFWYFLNETKGCSSYESTLFPNEPSVYATDVVFYNVLNNEKQ